MVSPSEADQPSGPGARNFREVPSHPLASLPPDIVGLLLAVPSNETRVDDANGGLVGFCEILPLHGPRADPPLLHTCNAGDICIPHLPKPGLGNGEAGVAHAILERRLLHAPPRALRSLQFCAFDPSPRADPLPRLLHGLPDELVRGGQVHWRRSHDRNKLPERPSRQWAKKHVDGAEGGYIAGTARSSTGRAPTTPAIAGSSASPFRCYPINA